MKKRSKKLSSIRCLALVAVVVVGSWSRLANAAGLPDAILKALPEGFVVMTFAAGNLEGDGRADYIVALARKDEEAMYAKTGTASPRPLLVFRERRDGSFDMVGRNDAVVRKRDQGGQCDPFRDGSEGIVVKGRYFTVQNGVACGQHWTDFVTFRFDPRLGGFVFAREIFDDWELRDTNGPNGQALVHAHTHVHRADPRHPIGFEHYSLR